MNIEELTTERKLDLFALPATMPSWERIRTVAGDYLYSPEKMQQRDVSCRVNGLGLQSLPNEMVNLTRSRWRFKVLAC